jgi:hypothetical protein
MEKGNLKWKSEIWEKLRWRKDAGKIKIPVRKIGIWGIQEMSLQCGPAYAVRGLATLGREGARLSTYVTPPL